MERFFSKIMKGNKILSFIELGRPWNSLTVILLSLLGVLLSNYPVDITNIMFLILSVFLIYNGSSALNDYFDFKIDTINMPYRPLERGSLSTKEASVFCLACYLLGNMLALYISVNLFFTVLLMSTISILYSIPPISLKDRVFLGNFCLSLVSMFTTLYSGFVLATNNLIMSSSILFQAIALTMFFSFFSILKDFKDIGGDKAHGKDTLVTKLGVKRASLINIAGTVMFFPMAILSFHLSFQNLSFVILSSLLFFAFLIPQVKIYRNPAKKIGEKAWGMGRFVFLLFMLSLFLF